ncbi:MAG TPA: DUF1015 domain-containing protein [Acidimicrobiales bacterium]
MPRFEPFAGLRYAPTVDMSDATAPPYDVISPVERAELAGRHPANAVHMDLPDEADGPERYHLAAAALARLQEEGVLRTDPQPAFYVYRMLFADDDGQERYTTGVLGALELTRPEEGQILPHEHTTPKAKSDRLDLLRATAHNLSPIWGLTPAVGLTALIEPLTEAPALASAFDEDDFLHQLWVLDDPAVVDAVRAVVASRPLIVADGHHRYETSLAYRDERRAAAGRPNDEPDGEPAGYDSTLAFVIELSDEQLAVRAIHRLVTGLPFGADIFGIFGERFEIRAHRLNDLQPATLVEEGAIGMVLPGSEGFLLRPRPGAFDPSLPDLDSARIAVALAELPPHEVVYQHGVDNVLDAMVSREAQMGLLLRPATVAQIAATAEGGQRMPPKTTFFWPKPRTGFVYRDLG